MDKSINETNHSGSLDKLDLLCRLNHLVCCKLLLCVFSWRPATGILYIHMLLQPIQTIQLKQSKLCVSHYPRLNKSEKESYFKQVTRHTYIDLVVDRSTKNQLHHRYFTLKLFFLFFSKQ